MCWNNIIIYSFHVQYFKVVKKIDAPMSLILLLPRPYRYHKDKLKLLFQNIKPFREVNMQLGRRFYSFKYVPSRKWPSHRMNAFWCISSFMFPQVTPVLMPVLLPLPWKYIKQDPDINNFISAKAWRTSKSGSKMTKKSVCFEQTGLSWFILSYHDFVI